MNLEVEAVERELKFLRWFYNKTDIYFPSVADPLKESFEEEEGELPEDYE